MNIVFNVTDNLCFAENNGSINIDRIIFDNETEASLYESYIVIWDGNLSEAVISSDGRLVTNLYNGIYTAQVVSTSSTASSNIYNLTISSPEQLKINNIQYSEYSCNDNNGQILIEIDGGTAPYTYYVGANSLVSNEKYIKFIDLPSNDYEVTVIDNNNCVINYPENISIKNGDIIPTILEILPPKIYDGLASIRLQIQGPGPFSILFKRDYDDYSVFVEALDTDNIESVSDNVFIYSLNEKLYPGQYTVSISNNFSCSINTNILIPNILPISVAINTIADNEQQIFNLISTLPIFDTLLIPYKHIQNNTPLWQAIKNYNLKDNISLKINNELYNFKIVRNMLNKYCINDNQIEILKLGNTSDDWFFYLYIAPSINLNTNPEFINAKISLVNNDNEFDITLGLSMFGDIDQENLSLIRGSFILTDLGYSEIINGGNVYVYTTDPENYFNFDFVVKKIKKFIYKNMYSAGYNTVINFLEQFNVLNETVTISQTSCGTTKDNYEYNIQIKNLIKALNNINNVIEISNIDNIIHTGTINISINGQSSFIDFNNTIINNNYNVEYFTFDRESTTLQQFYIGNDIIKNVNNFSGLRNGFIIIRIKDIYSNKPKFIINKNQIIDYDTHYIEAKKTIQQQNQNILDKFLYGDILSYVGVLNNSNLPFSSSEILPETPIITIPIIKATNDTTNTGSLNIRTLPQNVKCWIYGPKNYTKNFIGNTIFENLIPGLYTIIADDDYLLDNNLYYNEYKILIKPGSIENISIEFTSYEQTIFIKDI